MTKAMQCATEFAKWLSKNHLTTDVSIYVDKKRFHVTEVGELVYDIDCENPRDYLDYAGDFMSVATEGELYDVINYYNDFVPGYDERLNDEMDKLFEKFGFYAEQGHAWSFSLYKL